MGRFTWPWSFRSGYQNGFLNAPKDEKEPECLLCSPPKQMIAAGVVPKGVKWRVLGALYGLMSSPRSWSCYRDRQLRGFRWTCQGHERHMQPCVSDPNIWKVYDTKSKKLVSLVACYVDDILAVGPREERDAFLAQLRSVWDCSTPEHSEAGIVTYCGLEVRSVGKELRISQEKYVLELLKRHNDVEGTSLSPCVGWKEAFDDAESREESVSPEAMKKAQSLTGELLWLAVRARPEIAFPVARMSQLSARRPSDSILISLRYLRSNPGGGLVYAVAPSTTGTSEQFQHPVRETTVQAFSDASHGPCSGRSHQGILVS